MASKYDPLRRHLADLPDLEWSPTFRDIEGIIGSKLPASAGEHRTWWANHGGQMVHQNAWIDAGWRVETIDLGRRAVTFRKVRVTGPRRVAANPSVEIEMADLPGAVADRIRQARRAVNLSVRLQWQIVGRGSRKGERWTFPKGRSEPAILRLHLMSGDRYRVCVMPVRDLAADLALLSDPAGHVNGGSRPALAGDLTEADAVVADAIYADQAWIVADGSSRKANFADPTDVTLALANISAAVEAGASVDIVGIG
jgi:hypothetical protein